MAKRKLQQPARSPVDGPIAVRRIGDVIIIEAKQGGIETRVEMSEYNAWRAFGCLALMLEIPLSPQVAKAINLGDEKGNPPKAVIGYPEPKTLGERLAQSLTMDELARRGLVEPEGSE